MPPDSPDVLGGALFDDLLAEHVAAELGELPDNPAALAALRAACAEAKEQLSTAIAMTIPAPPGSKKATVVVNRTDFDGLIRRVLLAARFPPVQHREREGRDHQPRQARRDDAGA